MTSGGVEPSSLLNKHQRSKWSPPAAYAAIKLVKKSSFQMVKTLPSPSHPGAEDVEQPGVDGQHPLGQGGGRASWENPCLQFICWSVND